MSKIVGVNLSDGNGKGEELVSKLYWSESEAEVEAEGDTSFDFALRRPPLSSSPNTQAFTLNFIYFESRQIFCFLSTFTFMPAMSLGFFLVLNTVKNISNF